MPLSKQGFFINLNDGFSHNYWRDSSPHYNIQEWSLMRAARPMSLERPQKLTREIIKTRCSNILSHIAVDAFFYNLGDEIDEQPTKWKTYLYLRKCILDYRAGLPHEELTLMLAFLGSSSDNKKWLKNRLQDTPKAEAGEYWGSGMHEWIERCQLIQVLERSAGMVQGVEATKDLGCIFGDIDWLYLQAVCRSATKYLFYKLPDNSIFSGHHGSVKRDLTKSGFAKEDLNAFDMKIKKAFDDSTRLVQLIKRIINLFKAEITNAKKRIPAHTYEKRFLVDGTVTQDTKYLEELRQEKLLPFRNETLRELFEPLYICLSEHGDEDDLSIEIEDSSSDEEESLEYSPSL